MSNNTSDLNNTSSVLQQKEDRSSKKESNQLGPQGPVSVFNPSISNGSSNSIQRMKDEEKEKNPIQKKSNTKALTETPIQKKGQLNQASPSDYKMVEAPIIQKKESLNEASSVDYKTVDTPLIQKKENNTGLPDNLKSGVENLSGLNMDDVKVHYNSNKPAQLQAHAYAQGTDIHLGPGQEQHLPHEAWHVVQQKQGRVQPTTQLKGKVNVNDDSGLEKEADVMGEKALSGSDSNSIQLKSIGVQTGVVQKKDEEINDNTSDQSLSLELTHRSKGDIVVNYDETDLLEVTNARANENFKNILGESSFAGDIINKVNIELNTIFRNIGYGYESGVEDIERSISDEEQKKQMAISSFFAVAGILNTWIPLAAEFAKKSRKSLSSIEIMQGKEEVVSAFNSSLVSLGESKIRGPIYSTISTLKGLANSKPESVKYNIKKEINLLQNKSRFLVNATVFDVSRNISGKNIQMSSTQRGLLKSTIIKNIKKIIFPEYSGKNSEYLRESKTNFLKRIIMESGKITEGGYFSDSTISGNKNKEGSSVIPHALRSIGGINKFADTLKSPYEFAWKSLNSSLSTLGMEINTTEKNKQKAINSDDYLATNRGFKIKLTDKKKLNKVINGSSTYKSRNYLCKEGPMKDIKADYPSKTGFGYSSATTYYFTYDNVNYDNIEVWIHPSQYTSILGGKIMDIKEFSLIFNASGNADVWERYTTRVGFSSKHYKKHQISGKNIGIIKA